MSNLTITVIRPVVVLDQFTGPAVEAIAVGQWCRLDPSTGKVALGKATDLAEAAPGGMALSAVAAGGAVTVVKAGIVDIGDALGTINFGASIYLSDTDGTLADGTGTKTKVVGRVEPGWASTTVDRLLRIDQADAFTPAG